MHGSFTWNELTTTDVERAMEFYATTLGWTFEEFPIPEGQYFVARSGDRLVAGLGSLELGALRDATSSYWFSFIAVDAVDARVESAVRHGATLLQPVVDVPNVGRVAVLRDPTGATVGWMTGLES
jgi:uncharacterized protein